MIMIINSSKVLLHKYIEHDQEISYCKDLITMYVDEINKSN